MKSNEEIIEELNIKDRDIEIKVLEALKAKDNEAVLAVEIVTRNMEEAHRQEKIELVESVPDEELVQESEIGSVYKVNRMIKEWKTEKLNQLKDENQ